MSRKISAKVETYQDSEGQQKGRYVNIGVVLSNDNGEYILLDPTVNLSGVLQKQNIMNHKAGKKTGSSVMCSIFDDSQQGQQNNQAPPQQQPQQNYQGQQNNNQQNSNQQNQAPQPGSQNFEDEFEDDIPF